MNRTSFFAALAAASMAVASAPAQAQVFVRGLEQSAEANTDIVTLPESVPSSLSFRICTNCPYVTLSVDDTTRFFVEKHEVTLADLRRYASRGRLDLDVYYDGKSKTVTRLVLRTEPDAADVAAKSSQPVG